MMRLQVKDDPRFPLVTVTLWGVLAVGGIAVAGPNRGPSTTPATAAFRDDGLGDFDLDMNAGGRPTIRLLFLDFGALASPSPPLRFSAGLSMLILPPAVAVCWKWQSIRPSA